jgi:serine-type D-Ala-D-Ala carboxypeptidase (penicillin-binding protein 5/6)
LLKLKWSGKVRKIVIIIFSLLITLFSSSSKVHAENREYKAAVLIEVNSEKILYEYRKDEVLPQASITKLMTYYVLRDFLEQNSIENSYKVNVSIDMNKIPFDGSKINIKNGEVITMKELLESLLIVSANDSALQLETMFNQKTETNIVERMNQKVKEIGLQKSFYLNTTGLTENNQNYNRTTAYETAVLASRIIKEYPDVLKITSKIKFNYKGLEFPNTNKVMAINTKVDGLKTGHTDVAGYCLVATEDLSTSNGKGQPLRLVAVVFGCKSESDRVKETLKLLKIGEDNFLNEKVISKETNFQHKNAYYKKGFIEGTTNKDIYILKEKNESFEKTIYFEEDLPRNINKGEKIGKLTLKSLRDGSIYEYPLYSDSDFDSVFIIKRWFIYIKQLLSKG